MNSLQEKAIEELRIKNEKYIEEIIHLQKKVDNDYKIYDDFKNNFFDLINKMERANSHIPFLPFNNLYCIKDGEFSIPLRPCLKDVIRGSINEEFKHLSDEFIQTKEKKIEIEINIIKGIIVDNIKNIDELLDRVIASNSITKRLSGIDDKLEKLEKEKEMFWYPKEMSKKNYSYKGSIAIPPCIHNYQVELPFHRILAIENEYVLNTMPLHFQILKDMKATLLYINEFLPFAQLIE